MKRVLHTFFQTISKINLINEIIAELSSVVLAIIVIWGILLTYVFNKSDIFSVEISEYLLILTCFASIAFIQKEDRHVKVDMFIEKLSLIKRKKLEIITSFLCSLFCAIAAWEAATIMVINYQRNFFSTSLIKFPIWIPYFIIFYGFLMLTLQFLARIYSLINELINNSHR